MRMFNPPHPGEVLWGLHLEPAKISVSEFARRLDVDRKTLSRVINGRAAVSTEMAFKLGRVLKTTPSMWLKMQLSYDLWQAEHEPRLKKILAKLKPLQFPQLNLQNS